MTLGKMFIFVSHAQGQTNSPKDDRGLMQVDLFYLLMAPWQHGIMQ